MHEASPAISRREVLRRGAIIGGVLWASPVIQSFSNAAGAAGSPPPDGGGDPIHHATGHSVGTSAASSCTDLGTSPDASMTFSEAELAALGVVGGGCGAPFTIQITSGPGNKQVATVQPTDSAYALLDARGHYTKSNGTTGVALATLSNGVATIETPGKATFDQIEIAFERQA